MYFSYLWKFEVYNAVISFDDHFATWYPYEQCGKVVVHTVSLQKGFSEKLPKSLNRCPIQISWNVSSVIVKNPYNKNDPGAFVRIANLLGEVMNATLIYLNHTIDIIAEKGKNPNFDFSGILEKQNVPFAIFPFGYFDQLTGLDYSNFVAPALIYLALPPRKIQPKWKAFTNVSPLITWLILVTFLVCTTLFPIITKKSLVHTILLTYQMFVQLRIFELSQKRFLRTFLLMVLLFATFMNYFYTSMLSGIFTKPNYESPIKSLVDFAKSDIPLRCHKVFLSNKTAAGFGYTEQSLFYKLKQKHIDTNMTSLQDLFIEFLNNPQYAIPINRFHLQFFKNPQNFDKILYFSSHYTFAVKPRWHLKNKMDAYIAEIRESGLVEKFESMTDVPKVIIKENEAVIFLNLDNLLGIFSCWFCGCFLSVIVFILELWNFKIYKL